MLLLSHNKRHGGEILIDTRKLKAEIVYNGFTQQKVAEMLGISSKTFYAKMKKGVFDSDEISKMIDILKIENPVEIFFTKKVA